jgi:formylglycine-generating enzyme required for sulfatase activity
MTQPDATQLHQFLVDHFSLDDLKTLCFYLDVEFDDLGGDGRVGKARELVLLARRQSRLERLDEMLRRMQPEVYRQQFDLRLHAKTGIELIRIPAGPFLYGSADSDKMAHDREKPQRTTDLPEYWIGRYPVTNTQFARYVQATGHKTTAERDGWGRGWSGQEWENIKGADWRHPRGPESPLRDRDDHPVVQVSWDDAQAFCDWAGLLLPTEAQWEKAARGTGGRVWPWGDEPPTDKHCNFNWNVGDTTPVGKYSPQGDSPYGCADMAGNVGEWMGSRYAKNSTRALRGGAWFDDHQYTRAAYWDDYFPHYRSGDVGFRVAELLADPGS